MAGHSGEPETSDALRTFGAVLKALRDRAGMTQEEFSPMVQYSTHYVASIEQGRRFPPRDLVERGEELLDCGGVLRAAARHLTRRTGLASWFRQWAAFVTYAAGC
ncbi:helix-turn-helix domain-containing protein [Streptomyces sp. H27-D2]|uniref:helix-turn-helix domain-containing protein n=1 Tax=Streptomyces sp. H27-D2 TaxID=3046304 RepID=UPI002DBD1A64|nr:helix-turn-helix transcriptional regulator [Streptomyces sp. H27-D2]MEC4017519.1 helix-turn-helix transcriptional regulator [Streptomyces sp. H27-D2]